MSPKHPINLAAAPLSKTVLTAKRYRLETRWRETLVVTALLAVAFGLVLWVKIAAPAAIAFEYIALAGAVSVLLALVLICALQVLVMNHLTRKSMLPATQAQLEQVAAAHNLPVVARYLEAIQAQGRDLNRAEAGA